ncbi:MAG: decaprenyl-phosphate phosphoribosyltransferase, partial [Thermomicrobiales bacterium]
MARRAEIEQAAHQSRVVAGGKVAALVRAMRPLQWTKNGLVFAALVFDQHVFEAARLLESVVAALVFCAVSSGVYLVNDVRDAEHDRLHP